METETIDKLFLELSQVTRATTGKELALVTDFRVLMQLARALGQAKKNGDQEAITKAKAEHDAYKDLCLRADRMNLGVLYGEL